MSVTEGTISVVTDADDGAPSIQGIACADAGHVALYMANGDYNFDHVNVATDGLTFTESVNWTGEPSITFLGVTLAPIAALRDGPRLELWTIGPVESSFLRRSPDFGGSWAEVDATPLGADQSSVALELGAGGRVLGYSHWLA